MSLIDDTYFSIDVVIPSNDDSEIQAYIDRYEPEILKSLLGYELYKLVAAYNVLTSPQRIKDLVEGKEYEYNGMTIKWNGLINTEKISLIAYYVYYKWLEVNGTQVGSVGLTVPMQENSQPISHIADQARVWNEMLKYYGKLPSYFHIEQPYYESAYLFLTEHEDDYPEWEFNELDLKNRFGI